MKSFLKNVNIIKVSNGAAAGTSEVDSSILDMAGYDGVLFVADLGTVTSGSVLTLAVQQNTANSTTGMAAITNASATHTDASDSSNTMIAVDVYRPLDRYVRAAFTRTTANAVVNTIWAIQYSSRFRPTTLDASVLVSAEAIGS